MLKAASGSTVSDFVRLMVNGDLSKAIADKGKVVVPLKRIEIRKSEVLSFGEVPEIKEVPEQQPAEEAPVAPETPAQPEAQPPATAEETEELSEEELAEEAGEKEQ